jgi:beta-glucosidase
MKNLVIRSFALGLVCCGVALTGSAWKAEAQEAKPAYLDPSLPAEQRAAELVKQMTLEEKASQLVNQSRAIPRLKVPAYDWWSESLHGVLLSGTTEFPEPIGLAATFDPATIKQMGTVIGIEGRIKHAAALTNGNSKIFEGLDFWAPNINIFRDPRWGRGQETYGEDPFLTGRMGVAFVTGMQGDDPRYYRVISTPKHFAVHSGPESTRHTADVPISKHDELDTYLPAFRAAVTEGKAGSVMCAYNSINGEPACANEFLLQDQLRGKWGFKGYVVSDCGAVIDVFAGHHFKPTQPQASAISLERGMDNECVDFTTMVEDNRDYKAYIDAVKQGYLPMSAVDTAVTRLFTARMKLGMFDPPEMVPYSKIDPKELDSAEHRALARKLANESMVLLKNDGVLPLKTEGLKIAVVGPLADQTRFLLGNYNGTPTHTVSILEGLKAEFPKAQINFVEGTQFLSKSANPIPASLMSIDGKQGLQASYQKFVMDWGPDAKKPPVLVSRHEASINVEEDALPAETKGVRPLRIHWETDLMPTETGEFYLGLKGLGSFRLSVNGVDLATDYDTRSVETKLSPVHLDAGKPARLVAEYAVTDAHKSVMQLVWKKLDRRPLPEALEAAKNADLVVAVVGITSELEGEEMKVVEPGFKGGDRTSIDLPKPEQDLLESLATAHKPLVVVLTNGSALAVNWANDHANAILDAFYPGEEGGAAVAETLSGKNNPAGRLPVTFYKSVDQLPPFEDYSMKGRTYRYFTGAPLYPFGYGLSYTNFSYSGLTVPASLKAGSPLEAEVTVTNSGSKAGDEVAQLYLTFPSVPGAPLKALRAFHRVHLEPGASQTVKFELNPRDLSMVTEAGVPTVVEGAYGVFVGGGQPGTSAPGVAGGFSIAGTVELPE